MRILIVGAGAVGGFFGAHLLNAGRDVSFLVRAGRARQLADDGLRVVRAYDPSLPKLHLPSPKTVLAGAIPHSFDLIILSCKAYDLEGSVADLAPAIGPDTAILPLLNGMSHLDLLDARFGRRHVLGGDTTISTVKQPDGRILQLIPLDTLHLGDRDEPDGARIQRIAETLRVPGFAVELCTDILAAMWHKWVTISTAASATCLLRCTIGDIVAAGQAQLVHTILGETSAISTAAGYPPPQAFLDNAIQKFTMPGSLFTASMFRDISVNAPIEAQQIIGDLLTHAGDWAWRRQPSISSTRICSATRRAVSGNSLRKSATQPRHPDCSKEPCISSCVNRAKGCPMINRERSSQVYRGVDHSVFRLSPVPDPTIASRSA